MKLLPISSLAPALCLTLVACNLAESPTTAPNPINQSRLKFLPDSTSAEPRNSTANATADNNSMQIVRATGVSTHVTTSTVASRTPIPHVSLSSQRFPCAQLKSKPHVTQGMPVLSNDQWLAYQHIYGIESVCLPRGLGEIRRESDLYSTENIDGLGKMVLLRFDDSMPEDNAGGPYLLYSTYDFSIGAEFDRTATIDDRDALRSGEMPDSLVINGTAAFVRFQQGGCFGFCVLKCIVFPFDDYYVAVVSNLGEFDFDATDWRTVRETLRAGEYPAAFRSQVAQTDWLAQSLDFVR